MPSPEEIQRYLRATTQEYPKFGAGGIPVNADAFTAALQGFPESTNIEDRRDELGGFDAAAARTARSVRPPGGRQEGLGTFLTEKVPADMLSSLASLPQRATQAAAMLQQQGDVYDPAPAVEAAMLPMGGTFAGAPAGAMGAGIVKPIRAYHSSPHDFDKFDLSKIGTGQGAQSYGHGIYVAENPAVSGQGGQYWREFANKFEGPEYLAADKLQRSGFDRDAAAALAQKDIDALTEALKTGASPPGLANAPTDPHIVRSITKNMLSDRQAELDLLRSNRPVGPRTYEVNINAAPEQFLDWDKPLREQAANVRSFPGLADAAKEEAYQRAIASTNKQRADQLWSMVKDPESASGQMAYQEFVRQQNIPHNARSAAVSEQLKEAGIPGIKYLDQGSRPNLPAYTRELEQYRNSVADLSERVKTDPSLRDVLAHDQAKLKQLEQTPRGTSNYVVFDDRLIDILKKYGLAGLGIFAGAKAGSPDSLQSLDRFNQQ